MPRFLDSFFSGTTSHSSPPTAATASKVRHPWIGGGPAAMSPWKTLLAVLIAAAAIMSPDARAAALLVGNGATGYPSNVVAGVTTLRAAITSVSTGDLYVCWGPYDAGTSSRFDWPNVISLGWRVGSINVDTNVTGLLYGQRYYYRAHATNATEYKWASSAKNWVTLPPSSIGVTNTSATNLLTTSATLRGTLSATGSVFDVYVHWGQSDGTNNPAAWSNSTYVGSYTNLNTVSLSINVTDLLQDSDYWYTFRATNAATNAWATPSPQFHTKLDPLAFTRSMVIHFPGYTRDETLTNFPALVTFAPSIQDFSYSTFTSANGWDLRFADESTNLLPYEIESWSTTGTSYVWVRIPSLSNSTSTITAYWGCNSTTQPAYTTNGSVWANGFAGVWHLTTTSGVVSAKDSTSNRFDGTSGGTPSVFAGQVDGAASFGGSADYITRVGSMFDKTSGQPLTVSAWINPGRAGGQYQGILGNRSANLNWYLYQHTTSGTLQLHGGNPYQSSYVPPLGTWTYVAATVDSSSNSLLFANANLVQTVAGYTYGLAGGRFNMSGHLNPGLLEPWLGKLDEARVSFVARSTNWVWAEYMNMASAATFVNYGPVLSPRRPLWGTEQSAYSTGPYSGTFAGQLVSTGTVPTQVYLYWGSLDGGTNMSAWSHTNSMGVRSAGLLTNTLTNLPEDSTLYYRFYATNSYGFGWTAQTGTMSTPPDPTNYTFKLQIRFNGFDPGATLTNFPALVTLDEGIPGFEYARFASPQGYDLRFTSSNGFERLNYEIERWNTSGTSFVWVQVPRLVSTSTWIWAYWGHSSTTPTQPAYTTNGATWGSSHRGVWHLAEDVGTTIRDSSPFGNNGTAWGGSSYRYTTTGIADGADTLTGDNDWVQMPALGLSGNARLTLSGWVKASVIATDNLIGFGSAGTDNHACYLRLLPYNVIAFSFQNNDLVVTNPTPTAGNWIQVTGTYEPSTSTSGVRSLYVNGKRLGSDLAAGASFDDSSCSVGGFGGDYVTGDVDEMRIASTAHSSNWIWATYANIVSNRAFASIERVEPVRQDTPYIVNRAATNIQLTSAFANGELVSTGTSATAVSLYWGETDGDTNESAWAHTNFIGPAMAPGVLSQSLTSIPSNTWHYYRFYATNSAGAWWGMPDTAFLTRGRPVIQTLSAGNVTVDAAILSAQVTDTNLSTHVWAYLGTADGGYNPTAWSTSYYFGPVTGELPITLSTNVYSLVPSTVYYYRFLASNAIGSAWSETAWEFSTMSAVPFVRNDSPATSVQSLSAIIPGELVYSADITNDIRILWGTSDGGADPKAWANTNLVLSTDVAQTFQYPLTGLSGDTLYFCRFFAANRWSNSIAPSSVEFITKSDVSRHQFRSRIDLAGYTRSDALTNFPLLVLIGTNIAGYSVADMGSTTGNDLRFMNSNLTESLSFDVEEWNTGATSYVWVRLPELRSNTSFWVYWGGSNSPSLPPQATNRSAWASGLYGGVWHLGRRDSGVIRDAGQFGNHGAAYGGYAPAVIGKIASARNFDNRDDRISVPSSSTLLSANGYDMAVSFWMKTSGGFTSGTNRSYLLGTNAAYTDAATIFAQCADTNSTDGSFSGIVVDQNRTNGYVRMLFGGIQGAPPAYTCTNANLADTSWHHIAVNVNTLKDQFGNEFYLDGIRQSTQSFTATSPFNLSRDIFLADMDAVGHAKWQGALDEVRYHRSNIASNWVWAEFMNTASNLTFLSMQPAEYAMTSGVARVRTLPPTSILDSSATLNGELVSTGGYQSTVHVFWGAADGGTAPSSWASNRSFGVQTPQTLSTNVTGLVPGVIHFYRFAASNSAGWAWAARTETFRTTGAPVIDNSAGATGMTANAVWLNGHLTSAGLSTTTVFLHWGESDGGTDVSAWSNVVELATPSLGAFSHYLTNWPSQTLLHYRFRATNSYGNAWAPDSAAFIWQGTPYVPMIENWEIGYGSNWYYFGNDPAGDRRGTYRVAPAQGSATDAELDLRDIPGTPNSGSARVAIPFSTLGQSNLWVTFTARAAGQTDSYPSSGKYWRFVSTNLYASPFDGVAISPDATNWYLARRVTTLDGLAATNTRFAAFLDDKLAAGGFSTGPTLYLGLIESGPRTPPGHLFFDDIRIASSATVPAEFAAPLPYQDGFESGALSRYWDVMGGASDAGQSYVTPDTFGRGKTPYEGTYQLALDSGIAQATLNMQTDDGANLCLRFANRPDDTNAELPMPRAFTRYSTSEGVAISSDNMQWFRIARFTGSGGGWSSSTFAVDSFRYLFPDFDTLLPLRLRFQQNTAPADTRDRGFVDNVQFLHGPEILTATLPSGIENAAYPEVILTVESGGDPYTWSAPWYYEQEYSANTFDPNEGTPAYFWSRSDCFPITLPFAFPYLGASDATRTSYTSCWIDVNGRIEFKNDLSLDSADPEQLGNQAAICALWSNLTTKPTNDSDNAVNVYVSTNSTSITIRWKARYEANSNDVNVAVTLFRDGTIRLRYGNGNASGGLVALCQYGRLPHITRYFGQSNLGYRDDITFRPVGLPPGISFDSGRIAGRPTIEWDRPVLVHCRNNQGMIGSKLLHFVVSNQLEFATTALPVATQMVGYAMQLEATNGASPYSWNYIAPYAERGLGTVTQGAFTVSVNTYQSGGTRLSDPGGQKDAVYLFTFPFTNFPFFGTARTNCWVDSNGRLVFESSASSDPTPTTTEFLRTAMIAPLWADIDIRGGGIFTTNDDISVSIRWEGVYFDAPGLVVNFIVRLWKDGRIQFMYGAGNELGGFIGISSGNERDYVLSSRSMSGSMSQANDILFEEIFAEYSQISGASTWPGLNASKLNPPEAPLGFVFPFFGDGYDRISVYANGELRAGATYMASYNFPSIRPMKADIPQVCLNYPDKDVNRYNLDDSAMFLWQAISADTATDVARSRSFGAQLYHNGDVRFLYGPGNHRPYVTDTNSVYGPIQTLPPTGVTYGGAYYNASLNSTGWPETVIFVCSGTTDGGTSIGSWGAKTMVTTNTLPPPRYYSVPRGGLTAGTRYYYRFLQESTPLVSTGTVAGAIETLPATAVDYTAATFNGRLNTSLWTMPGGGGWKMTNDWTNIEVRLYWGFTDGGNSTSSWTTCTVLGKNIYQSTNAPPPYFYWSLTNLNLASGTFYYYRYFALTGGVSGVWAGTNASFRTLTNIWSGSTASLRIPYDKPYGGYSCPNYLSTNLSFEIPGWIPDGNYGSNILFRRTGSYAFERVFESNTWPGVQRYLDRPYSVYPLNLGFVFPVFGTYSSNVLVDTFGRVFMTNSLPVQADDPGTNAAVYSDGWGTGDNGGFGFGTWTNTLTPGSGSALALWTNAPAWGRNAWYVYSTNGGVAEARRAFNSPLETGDVFQIEMHAPAWLTSTNNRGHGIQLLNASGATMFTFARQGYANWSYYWTGTGWTWGWLFNVYNTLQCTDARGTNVLYLGDRSQSHLTQPLDISVRILTSNTCELLFYSIYGAPGSECIRANVQFSAPGPIAGIRLFADAPAASSGVFFRDMRIDDRSYASVDPMPTGIPLISVLGRPYNGFQAGLRNDILLFTNATSATIQWNALSRGNASVSALFGVTLHNDGRIQMRYGKGTSGGSDTANTDGGVIGFSDGAGNQYLSSYSGLSMYGAPDLFFRPLGVPFGMGVSSNGYLTGAPYAPVGFTYLPLYVEDAVGGSQRTEIPLYLKPNPANQPPRILSVSPPEGIVVIGDDTNQIFSVTAMDPEGSNLTYRWTWDTVVTNIGGSNIFSLTPVSETRLHEVRCVVGDGTYSYTNSRIGPRWFVVISRDMDHDGMPNAWETQHGLNPRDPSDAALDPDKDFLSNLGEYQRGTNPNDPDFDNDTLYDGWEVRYGTDPTNTSLSPDAMTVVFRGEYTNGPMAARRVFVDTNNMAYLANGPYGVSVIDVSTPTTPTLTGSFATADFAYDVMAAYGHAYVADGTNGLAIYTVTNLPSVATNASYTVPSDTSYGLDLHYPYAYVAFLLNSFKILDVSNPSAPAVVGQGQYPGYYFTSDVKVYSNRLFEAGPTYIITHQLDSLTNATLVGAGPLDTFAFPIFAEYTEAVVANDNYAFVAFGAEGLVILSVSDLSSVTYVTKTYDHVNAAVDVAMSGSNLVLMASALDGIQAFNVSIPSQPRLMFSTNLNVSARGIFIRGPYIYVAADSRGLVILEDLSVDEDSDGLPDYWERANFTNLNQTTHGDFDSDGIENWGEYQADTSPTNTDTDADGVSDRDEIQVYNSNPRSNDTDADGMPDAWEAIYWPTLNPIVDDATGDPDGDGLVNRSEYIRQSFPTVPDTDGDRMNDGAEVNAGRDPASARDGAAVFYAFEDSATNLTLAVDKIVPFMDSATPIAFYASATTSAPAWTTPLAVVATNWGNSSNYLEFTVTVDNNHELDVDRIGFDLRRDAGGPTNWFVRYSLDNYASPIPGMTGPATTNWMRHTNDLSPTVTVPLGGGVTFRICFTGAVSSSAAIKMDNLFLLGVTRLINQAPVITPEWPVARSVYLPGGTAGLVLRTTITDDEPGAPFDYIRARWYQVSGPATAPLANSGYVVAYANTASLANTIRFTKSGDYVFRCTAFDGLLTTTYDLFVRVGGSSIVNTGPSVSAGSNRTLYWTANHTNLQLNGAASDDGRPVPPGSLSKWWEQVSPPSPLAVFSDTNALNPTVAFDGTFTNYVFRLNARDGAVWAFSEMSVSVQEGIPGVLVSTNAVAVDEYYPATPGVYSISLLTSPTGNVTVTCMTDTNQLWLSPTSVTFSAENWTVPQTISVYAVNDSIPETNKYITVSNRISYAEDAAYTGRSVSNVIVRVKDDDLKGVTVSPSALVTSETGDSVYFTVELAAPPLTDVRITVSSGDSTEGTNTPTWLIFTPDNWNIPRIVTVFPVNDDIDDGNVSYPINLTSTDTPDAGYRGISIPQVMVQNLDDDTAGIIVQESGGTTRLSEAPGKSFPTNDTYTVRLTSQPTAPVIIAVQDTLFQVTPSPASLVFTATNWNPAQTVTLTAINDSDAESLWHTGVVRHAVSSADPKYHNMAMSSVIPWVLDNDSSNPPVIVMTSPGSGDIVSPASVTLQALANDDDGSVTNVSFYWGPSNSMEFIAAGTTNASGLCTITWNNIIAGTSYTLRAVARDNMSLVATSQPVTVSTRYLPPPWTNVNIGTAPLAGSASWTATNSGTFSLKGYGPFPAGNSDVMQFAYQPTDGDLDLTAYVRAQGVPGTSGAGLMLRADLSPVSPCFMIVLDPASNIYVWSRSTYGGAFSAPAKILTISSNLWLRLTMTNATSTNAVFYPAYSANGTTWTAIAGPTGIPQFPDNAYIGMCSWSSATNILATNLFDRVSVNFRNRKPQITLISPTDHAVVTNASTAVSLEATVWDDALPSPISLTSSWSVVSAPAGYTFAQSSSTSAVLRFGEAGDYWLRFTASDGPKTSTVDRLLVLGDSIPPDGYMPTRCTGGTVTNYNQGGTNWTAHIFTNVGLANLNVLIGGTIEYLVVAGGGGGGGGWQGGGGGAGGFLTGTVHLTEATIPVLVGTGGFGALYAPFAPPISGGNSSFYGLTAIGGGSGSSEAPNSMPASGGSGGGAGNFGNTGGAGTPGQGYKGANGGGSVGYGGGGAGTAAVDGSAAGGPGKSSSISGAAITYATGGYGIGSRPGSTIHGSDAAPCTGKGGNGGGGTPNTARGGKGGSGIVIIRYANVINIAPAAEAGTNKASLAGGSVAISASVSDDGKPVPPAATTVRWSVSPTTGVSIANFTNRNTTVTASLSGDYVIALRTYDGSVAVLDSLDLATTDLYGHAPIARPDTYTTSVTVVSIPTPGVLTNDTDEDGNSLSVSVEVPPQYGILSLETDGGFTYTALSEFAGADSFVYRVHDGHGRSSTATANIVTDAHTVIAQTADAFGSEPGDPASFRILRFDTNSDLAVYFTFDGTAEEGVNFLAVANPVTIPAGASDALVTIMPTSDSLAESVRYVRLTIQSNAFYTVGSSDHATVTLSDNEAITGATRRVRFVFAGYDRASDLSGFPALIRLGSHISGFSYDTFASPSGADLRFTDEYGTELPYEISEWNTFGVSYAWVRLPRLSGEGTVIWALWGDPSMTASPAYTTSGAVWTNGFRGAWHMEGTSPSDSTSYGHTGVGYGNTNAVGIVGLAQGLDGASRIDVGDPQGDLSFSTDFTLGVWVKAGFNRGADRPLVSRRAPGSQYNANYSLDLNSGDGKASAWFINTNNAISEARSVTSYDNGQWHYLVSRFSGFGSSETSLTVFVDGVMKAEMDAPGIPRSDGSQQLQFGHDPFTDNFTVGLLDEVRIAGVARSADWVWAEYMNIASNAAFVESSPVLQFPSIVSRPVTNVGPAGAELVAYLVSTGSTATAVYACWGSANGFESIGDWEYVGVWDAPQSIGVKMTNATGLTSGDLHYFNFAASNQNGWAWSSPSREFQTGGVWIEATDPMASEIGPDTATFTLRRYPSETNTLLTVAIAYEGTATAGSDYDAPPASVTFAPGQTSKDIVLVPKVDKLVEGADETVVARILPGTYRIADGAATAYITDATISTRVKITFTGYDRAEPLTNFPALVTIPESFGTFYYLFTSTNWHEMRFYDQTETTELPYEIEQWNTGGTSYAWVRIPALTNGTFIWATAGNAALAANPAVYCTNGLVWSAGYQGVYHFKGINDFTDSTSNRWHGVNSNSTYDAGQVAGGRDFDNTNTNAPDRQRITIPTTFGLGISNATIACWAKLNSQSEYGAFVKVGATNNGFAFGVGDAGNLNSSSPGYRVVGMFDGTSSPTLPNTISAYMPDTWTWVALRTRISSGNNSFLFQDGSAVYTGNKTIVAPAGATTYIGGYIGPAFGSSSTYRYTDATLDEVRISNVARSTNWLWAEFMNMGSNALFQTYEERSQAAPLTAIAVSPTTLLLAEGGGSSAYAMQLSANPAASVTVTVSAAASSMTISPTTLVFDASNYATPQTVTVSIADDDLASGARTNTLLHRVSSPAPSWNNVQASNVTVIISDNDISGLWVSTNAVLLSESGVSNSIALRLQSQPRYQVTVTPQGLGSDDVTITPQQLLFTTNNWNTAQILWFKAIADGKAEGIEETLYSFSFQSEDALYGGIAGTSVTVTIEDGNLIEVSLSTNALTVEEGGGAVQYSLSLLSRPDYMVVLDVSSPGGQLNLSTNQLRFSPTSWYVAQTVVVSAVDDVTTESSPMPVILYNSAFSYDALYSGLGANLTVWVGDNDSLLTLLTPDDSASELGPAFGYFRIVLAQALPTATLVDFAIGGSASNTVDYLSNSDLPLPTSVVIPAGQTNFDVFVYPIPDDVAEGVETVTLTVTNAGTQVGSPSNGTIYITPLPIDTWKILHFGANANSPAAADGADYDGDWIRNLVEYVLGRNPTVSNSAPEFAFALEQTVTGTYATVTYWKTNYMPDASLHVQATTNLSGLIWFGGTSIGYSEIGTSNGLINMKARILNPAHSNTTFEAIRLKATRPPALE